MPTKFENKKKKGRKQDAYWFKQVECSATKREFYPQKPWTPQQKRQAIAAELPTPGPNSMPLPFYIGRQVLNSAIVHRPEWSLHQRIENSIATFLAGPASYSIRDFRARGGKVTSPAYTFRVKTKPHSSEKRPGPATYDAKVQHLVEQSPAYTLRCKPPEPRKFRTPAPNEYTLPSVLGHHHKPPSYVMGCRMDVKSSTGSPGPGAYSHHKFNEVLPCMPQFTVRAKAADMHKDNTPGPGTYCPEKVILNLSLAPRSTFGVKHSPFSGIWHPHIVGPRCS